ncbi:pilin [Lysobacter sp. CFH 32150]|uniref:pilin n=1 Tax=Lysobacter sp. CFH 32150 TaxID=2927128 RepID=UPI001FA7432D|nr:pilin [Lysobacter sp. CFH 32150]MCI4567737.1 pilin [Lysobacter sp. CFH 32150]
MKKNMQGFTLIELMIVVAIIAILAAIAISQYQDYVIRSQVSEGSALADGMKTALAEFYQNKGRWPPVNTSAGLAIPVSIVGNYVSQGAVNTNLGTIQMTFSATAPREANTKIDTKILIFSAVTHAGTIEWNCLSANIQQKWLGSSCVNRAPTYNPT